jgi:hypothetical protein
VYVLLKNLIKNIISGGARGCANTGENTFSNFRHFEVKRDAVY